MQEYNKQAIMIEEYLKIKAKNDYEKVWLNNDEL